MPELVASLIATMHGQGDIAVGNVVGSNLFNILAVLGISAMVAPDDITGLGRRRAPGHSDHDCGSACISSVLLHRLSPKPNRGGSLIGYLVAYTAYVTMGATDALYTRSFETAMIGFVIPLTVLAVAFSVYQTIQSRRQKSSCMTES